MESSQAGYAVSIENNRYMLIYGKSDQMEIIRYSDSDTVEDLHRAMSSCWLEKLYPWKSVKQTCIASSTMVEEFITCYETSNQGMWLYNFVIGQRIFDGIGRPFKLFVTINQQC